MVIRCATGSDFDRLNDMAAYSRLVDLVAYAGGQSPELSAVQLNRAIDSRAHFIMQVW